ncbi:Glyco_hydro_28 domain-containing protein [Fagus crenata]
MSPVFDGKLLLVLSVFCFNGVFGRERGIKIAAMSGVEGFEGQRSRILHHKGRRSAAACEFSGSVNFLIPKGTYLIGPIQFAGPCHNGYLKATTDLSKYGFSAGWVEFGWVEGLSLTGGGTFDGQGATAWPYNNCPTDSNCKLLPTNVKFMAMNKTVVRGITSLNSKFFHLALLSGSHFGTGDDCISVGQGNSQVTISGVNCGPGHGISVGSLGRYRNERDVSGLLVRDCTMRGTTNGIRIKTWANSPGSSAATNMTFENTVMNNVTNPIIIDQTYCPFTSCTSMAPSRVKISDIYFKNIRGSSSSKVANIYLEDVHLDLSSREKHATSTCKNVRAKYIGTRIPPPCS